MAAVKDQEVNESIEQRARRAELEIKNDKLRSRIQELEDERLDALDALGVEIVTDDETAPQPGASPEIETEGVFMDNPLAAIFKPLTEYFKAIKPPMTLEPPKSEHKVRIFYLPVVAPLEHLKKIESEIEAALNDGYYCHMPTVVNDYVIMDFSRRKETKENEA